MKKLLLTLFIIATLNLSADNWTQKASVGTRYLRLSVGFSIGSKGYVCGGMDSLNESTDAFWEYDPVTNAWTQKANYGGGIRSELKAFSLQGKGYVGMGVDNSFQAYFDWWQYDPTTNLWTQKASFPGSQRLVPFSFDISNKGYIFGGESLTGSCFNDIWEYDPTIDSWTQKTSCPCTGRLGGASFSIGNKGYIAGGIDTTGTPPIDFWEYNPATDNWTQKANIPASQFIDIGSFSIGNYGYVTCGEAPQTSQNNYFTTLWQYNPLLNQWATKASFPDSSRDEVASFSIGNYGYVGWGGKDYPMYNNLFEYTPDSADMIGITEIVDYQIETVYPNPFTTNTTITFTEQQTNIIIKIADVLGKEIRTINFTGKQLTIDKGEMKAGIYFLQTTDEKKQLYNRKIIIQ